LGIIFEVLKPVIELVISFISTAGYPGIFVLMILESALIPIPSEIIMPFSGFLVTSGKFQPIFVILAGSFGNLVGSILTYYLGIRFGREFIIKYGKYIFLKQAHLEFTERLFEKYGNRISFVGRLLPGIRTYISLPAGIGRAKIPAFILYSLAGSIIWNTMLTYAGMQLGSNWQNIDKYSIYLDIAAIAAVVFFIVWLIYKSKKEKSLKASD